MFQLCGVITIPFFGYLSHIPHFDVEAPLVGFYALGAGALLCFILTYISEKVRTHHKVTNMVMIYAMGAWIYYLLYQNDVSFHLALLLVIFLLIVSFAFTSLRALTIFHVCSVVIAEIIAIGVPFSGVPRISLVVMTIIAGMVGAIVQARLHRVKVLLNEEIGRAEDEVSRIEAMAEMASQINLAITQRQFFEIAIPYIRRIMDVSGTSVTLVNKDTGLTELYKLDLQNDRPRAILMEGMTFDGSLIAQVMETGKLRYMEDETKADFELVRPGTGASIVAPMSVGTKVLGTLNLGYGIPRKFSETDLYLALSMASILIAALERHRLLNQTKKALIDMGMEAGRLRHLNKLTDEIDNAEEEEQIYQTIAKYLPKMIPCDFLSLLVLTEDGQSVSIRVLHESAEMENMPASLSLQIPIFQQCLANKVPIAFYPNMESYPEAKQVLEAVQLQAGILAPLVINNVCVGAFLYGTRQENKYDAATEERFEHVVDLARQRVEKISLIESLKETARLAQAATVAKSAFLANMSHEIRTPMNGVIGMADLLSDSTLTEDQTECVEMIRNSGQALLEIINDILDFSKIEAGHVSVESIPFDLYTCVGDAISLLAPKAAAKGIDFGYFIDAQTPAKILGDPTRLRQIIINLVSNGIKFTSEGAVTLTVRTMPSGQPGQTIIQFSIEDSGIGIPKNRQDRLFKSFSQIDESTTRKYGGTGLGLAISHKLAQLMGGEMWVESEEGMGSTFHFTIQTMAPQEEQLSETSGQLAGKRVVLLAPAQPSTKLVVQTLDQWQCQVDEATTAKDALRSLDKSTNAIVVDMSDASEEGRALYETLHEQAEAPPFIFIGAPLFSEDPSEKKLAEVPRLNKPVRPERLKQALLKQLTPAQTPQPRAPSAPNPQPKSVDTRDMLNILIVEDNIINQKVARRILEKRGFCCETANNGAIGVEALAEGDYDIILMDLQMPVMDGLTATHKIRELYGDQHYIIAVTANATEADRQQCLDAGMNDFVSKPVRPDTIFGAIDRSGLVVAAEG